MAAPALKTAARPGARRSATPLFHKPLPHPSWRVQGGVAGAGAALSPEDFWKRLGI